VSFVIPNFNDDMHDGTIAAGDTWLQTNLGGYVQWAQTHNSLLIITWDHDGGTPADQVATLFAGPMVRAGYYGQTINHYNMLRTVEDMYGLPYLANDASAASIANFWKTSTQVSITATKPNASEVPPGSDPGIFTVTRNGPTTAPLTVHYTVGGSAVPGVDYVALAGSVTIPAGASSATITVSPLDDGQPGERDESVSLFLTSDPTFALPSPGSVATVFIADNDSPNGKLPITRFAQIGDFGWDSATEQAVSDLVHSWSPAFIPTTGDNNYQYGSAAKIDQNIGRYYHDYISPYLGTYGAGAPSNQFYPSLGFHDWGYAYPNPTGDQPYLNYFPGLPGNRRYYDVALGLVHLFIVDSDQNEPDGNSSTSVQASWLKGRLAAATEPYKIVVFHNPPYSSGYAGDATWMQWPFQAWGATVVLNGKSHDYERLIESGFPYLVDGLGGEEITLKYTNEPGSQVFYNANYGAMLVEATTADITFQFITVTGQVIDTYTIPSPPTAPGSGAASPPTAGEVPAGSLPRTPGAGGVRIPSGAELQMAAAALGSTFPPAVFGATRTAAGWTVTVPAGTSPGGDTRSANTAAPDGARSARAPVRHGRAESSPGARLLLDGLTFSPTDSSLAPDLLEMAFAWSP
jgi:hypothetical protein